MLTPKKIATKSAAAMWDGDAASKWLGAEMLFVDEGTATFTLTVEKHHANGHGICHGGFLFTLADTTFAFACNSRNQNTLAQHCAITYIAPAQIGDVLTAVAHEVSVSGRSGIYDVQITTQTGEVIAEFRGHSRTIKGQLF